MSDESEQEVLSRLARKGKRHTPRIEDSGSESSDSSFERRRKRKRALRVESDAGTSITDSDTPLGKRASKKRVPRVESDAGTNTDSDTPLERQPSKKRVPRVMSDEEEDSSGDSDAGSDWDGTSGEEDMEGDENGSEADSQSGSEESGSSSCSDWESELEEEELHFDEDEASLTTAPSSSTPRKKEKKASEGAAGSSSSATPAAAAYMSDSSDGQSEKCPICLLTFTTQEIGTPESCDHSFCVDCLQEWSKNVNTCPVDRQVFTLILVRRSLEGKVIRKIPVEPPRQEDEEEVQEDPTYCEVCGECDREDRMLLCDGCDLGYHLECLDPPMDTVPLEEWFCPDCTMSNSVQLAEEVDIQDGELMDLLEDPYVANMPPLRPRVSRLLPRTRQSERVRATMMTRQRQRNQVHNREPVQPSTSSGFDSLEADSNASVTSSRQRTATRIPKKTTRKRRKTTKRKTTKRKKRRKTTKKTKSTSLSANSSKEVSKRRHKKRRKVKRKKRKTSLRKVRRPRRIAVPHSVKGRLAEHLGVCPPRRPGQTIPDVRPRVTSSRIDFQRSRAGIPTLHLFGQRDQLDYFSSGSEHEDTIGGGGDTAVIARPRTLSMRSASSIISRKRVFPSASRSLSAIQSQADSVDTDVSDKSSVDLIGSILSSQEVWHSKKSVVTINRDGSLQIKSDGDSGTPKRNSDDRRPEEGIVRTDDSLSQISSSAAPVNVSEAGASTSGHITQAPMYPGRGGSGNARPPASGNFQQFGGSRYSSSPSYHGYQSGRGYSNFSPSSNFDSRGARAGYANFLNSGPPPPPFRGGPPLRFRMAPRFPIRRPLLPPVRPQLQRTPTVQQIPPSSIEEFQPEDEAPDCQKTSRAEDEDEEIDIYSDIEVGGGSGSGGPGGGGSEPDEGDRNLELAYEALQPPPIPPAMLMGMGGDAMSDEEPGSDSELVIDDNITPASPPDNSEKYDPEADTEEDKPEIPESEKYDPAEPSNDTDDEEEAATATTVSATVATQDKVIKATEALSISVTETCSLSNIAHSSSNSNASYLHSPTYGDSNIMINSDVKLSSDAGSRREKLDGSTASRKLEGLADERHSVADEDEDEEDEECPNFSIYSAASMDIARRTGEDDDIPVTKSDAESPETVEDSKIESEEEKEVKGVTNEEKDENSNISVIEKLVNEDVEEFEKEPLESIAEDKDSKPPTEPEEGELSEKHLDNSDAEEDDQDLKDNEIQDGVENRAVQRKEQEPETVEGVKKLSLVEEIFGSDDNDSLIGGATSAVSAATVDNAPQASVTPLGLEGLDTETISETEEAINFEDDLSQDDGFLTAEEDGEIPSVKRKKKKKNRKPSTGGSVGEEAATAKDHTPPEPIDYEEGEIVDDKPKQHEPAKKDKKATDKKDKSKYDKDGQKSTDENFDITGKSSKVSEEDRKKKKKKSSGDKARGSKERAVLSSSENKDKNKDKTSKEDSNIAWKKLSKSSKERNYRDTKAKPDADPAKTKDAGKKKDTSGKDALAKKDKKKKEKRKDMERYDVRKVVSDKKRKRRDAFGRDLSRDRSYSRSVSRSRGRSYDRSRARSRSVSRSRVTRSRGRSPVKSRIRSRSRSRVRSRSRSRNRSRSRSKPRSKIKSKDRLRKSRSKEKQRARVSRSRSRGRRSRSRTRSRSRNRSRLRSRSRSPVRSRDRRDRRGSQKCRYRERRSWSHSWTPSWSRSRSVSCSSYSRSCTPTPRRFNRTYSRSFSRSWSRERHERIPLLEKKTGVISKTAKKLTVIVPNTKDDSERHRKKEKKRKEAKKNKEALAALEKRKKRKEKSPAPSKEVFTSGDNILVSVNFKSNKSTTNKDVSVNSGAIAGPVKEAPKRKHDGSFEMEREPVKKIRKEKVTKDKGSPRQKNGISSEKVIVRTGEKKSKKAVQKAGNKASRVATLVNKKPVAIIDLDQSPFHEQTPSPTDLIVLSDSDDGMNKENDREEESLNSLRNLRPSSSSPKTSCKQSIIATPSNALVHTPESQSPPMNAVGSYLVTSTGPKTPPEPQIKFSIAAKPQLRSINNPLREDEEDLMAEEAGLDDLDQRIEEELDRGLGELHHKGPNTPPEPRGPTTPCSPPTSPDAYDPFDPTKSGTPSPVGAGASLDGPPSPARTPTEQLLKHAVIGRESPMVSDLEDLASKSLEARVTTPTMPSAEEVADQSSQSPDRSKLSVRGDNTMASSPSILPETSLPPPVSSDNEISQPAEAGDGTEKSKQMSLSLPPPGPAASALSDQNTTTSPERSIPVVITSQPPSIQATPVKPLFPNASVKQVVQQQPITSTPTHATAPAPVFPTLTPANIASILCTPPPATLPLSRMALFNPPTMSVPQLMVQQQQQQPVPHLLGSPVVVPQRPPPAVVRTTPEKLPTPAKLTPVRTNTVQNGEQTQNSQKQPPDTSTDVVDMDLESPYSPGSSEGDDLFDPPAEVKSSSTTASFGNRTVPQPTKNTGKLPLPLVAMLHKSPSKPPPNQDKFDTLFGLSPLRPNKTAPARTTSKTVSKAHHAKASKAKGRSKGGKREIAIKMDEDQLQILDDLPSSAVELQVKDKFLKKLNRQERVVEEVKLSLKPHYTKKHITKEEYKEILRRSVPKICHNKSGEINPIKIGTLVHAYVKKYRYAAKKKNVSAGTVGKTTKPNKTTMWS